MSSASQVGELPFVSVVVPCYNNAGTIADCLRGLEAQSYPPDRIEIIVADNGSKDGSSELISRDFPAVKLLHVTQKGSAYARNAGNAAARGLLILSTDADCVADRDWAASLVKAMISSDPKTAAIGGTIAPHTSKTLVERYAKAWVSQPQPDLAIRYAATPNAIFSAEALRAVGGFDGTMVFDDSDLGIRLAKAGYLVSFTDKARVYHRNPARIRELYRHRHKYGRAGFALAEKHPDLFGDPRGAHKRKELFRETLRRVLGNLIKLPFSFFRKSSGHPRGWPLVDATMAWANYAGFVQASRAAEQSQR